MNTMTATYSPDDDKLRFSALSRLDQTTYDRIKALGFSWAPKQERFVAFWAPDREDILLELCGEIEDENLTTTERAAERAERFESYGSNRKIEADAANQAAENISQRFAFGQPILVGHHSEKRARRDSDRIAAAIGKAIVLSQRADYWKERAAYAVRHAEYRLRPDVRARRIKTLEAETRRLVRDGGEKTEFGKRWIEHLENRLHYERAMLAADGGIPSDHAVLEKGGAIQSSPWTRREDWAYIEKVNRVTVTIDGGWCDRNIPLDKIEGVMTAAQVEHARSEGRVVDVGKSRHFSLADAIENAAPNAGEGESTHV